MTKTILSTFLIMLSSCNYSSKQSNGKLIESRKDDSLAENVTIDTLVLVGPDSIPYQSDYIIDSGSNNKEDDAFFIVEEMPEFSSGREDLKKYLCDNTQYPQTAIEDSIEGVVFVRCIINENGSVTKPQIIRGIRSDLNDECIRVIKNMPDWKPGKQSGKNVKVRFVIPFSFKLNSVSEKDYLITPKNEEKEK